jgi:cytochrome c553
MKTTSIIAAFVVLVTGLIWMGTSANDASWTGNKNQCVGACYEEWKAAHEGGIARFEANKQAALASASPAVLGKQYFGQCVACHGGQGEGGIGPQLAGQDSSEIVSKLNSYRAGEERGAQSAMMYPVAKPMSDADIDNLAAYIGTL